MRCLIFYFSCLLIGFGLLGCKQTSILIENRSSADVDSIRIARPLVVLDMVSNGILEDSSTKVSIRMEEDIMDALEYALPQRVHYKYLLLPDSTAAIVDSCLISLKNRLLVSADADLPIPQPLIEIMRQDSLPFLLWIYADGFELTRKSYKTSKTGAIIANILGGLLGVGWQEMPTKGDGKMLVFIIDRDKHNIAYYKTYRMKDQYPSESANIDKAVIQLLNSYFYTYKKGKSED